MRGFEQVRKNLKVAGIMLLLLLVSAMGSSLSAQIVATPAPWPTPAAVPQPPAIFPASQTVPVAFDVTGMLQYASLDPTPGLCDVTNTSPSSANPPLPDQCKTTGGWLEVANTVIKVPANVVVVYPNTLLTWEESFELNPFINPSAPETGLAMADTRPLPGNYIVHVQGNMVNGQYIAGLVFINQVVADAGIQGFIEKFDYANSIMYIAGTRIQLNDPWIPGGVTPLNPDGSPFVGPGAGTFNKGRYSAGQDPTLHLADPRMAVDQNNPTVRSQSGYPMCIPQFSPYIDNSDGSKGAAVALLLPDAAQDSQCPEKNRPRDSVTGTTLVPVFSMNAPDAPATAENPIPQDPYLEAPFEVGDFVSVLGSMGYDANGPLYSATQVMDTSVGIQTAPQTDPGYVLVEVLVQGTGGVPDPAFPQEAGVRTRVEGFSTDPFRAVDVSAIDQDCNGNLIFRQPAWASNFPVEPGPPGIGVIGRWRARFPQGGDFLPATQNVGARISGGLVGKQKNGLTFGEYQLPEATFIFAENITPGTPPPAGNFSDITFLVNGLGPLPMVSDVFDSFQVQLGATISPFYGNQQLGQLAPFPAATTPAPSCIPGTFTSVALPNYASNPNPAYAGVTVTLDGTASTPPTGPFTWAQVPNGSSTVTLSSLTAAKPTFVTPFVTLPETLVFSLVVGDGVLVPFSTAATISVPIVPPPPSAPPVVAITSTPASPVPSSSTVTLTATGVDPAGGTLTYTWVAPAGVVLVPGAPDGSVQTFIAPSLPTLSAPLPLTFTVTATSSVAPNLTGTATTTVVVNPVSDFILINATGVVYRTRKARLVVTATDFTPNITMTCTLDIVNPATGLQYTGLMGPEIPAAPGIFTITFSNVPPPNLVTVTSSAGGVATSGISFLR